MKVYCEKCGCEISRDVDSRFEQFDIGHIICPECHSKQKRYISEADLLIYFGVSATFYGIMAIIISTIFSGAGFNLVTGVMIAVLFVFAYWFQKSMSRMQYVNAYLKSETKNKDFGEDKKEVGKRLRWQFLAFVVLALMIGTDPAYIIPFILMVVAFIAITFLKVYLLLKNGRG